MQTPKHYRALEAGISSKDLRNEVKEAIACSSEILYSFTIVVSSVLFPRSILSVQANSDIDKRNKIIKGILFIAFCFKSVNNRDLHCKDITYFHKSQNLKNVFNFGVCQTAKWLGKDR